MATLRTDAIMTIRHYATASLLREMEDYLDAIDHQSDDGEPRDLVDAFLWSQDGLELTRAHKKNLLRIEIQLGIVRPILREAMQEQIATGLGVRRSDFQTLDGQLYENAKAVSLWEEELA